MTLETEVTRPSGINLVETDPSQAAHLDVTCPRSVRNESGFRPDIAEDQITFRRWRLGFVVFYGALISLLGGIAVVVDRPGTFVSAAAHKDPPAASTNLKPRLAQGR